MSGAVDKLLELAGQGPRTTLVEDPAGDLVLAARTALTELHVRLASGDDDEAGESGDDGDADDSHTGHGTYKALVKRGMDKKRAASMCAKADKRVKAARLAEAALLALNGLAAPLHDWVEATAQPADSLQLAAGQDDRFADPGYLGKAQLLIDTSDHVRATNAYIRQDRYASRYTPLQLAAIQDRVAKAMTLFALSSGVDEDSIAADAMLQMSVLTAADRRKPSSHTIGDSEDFPIPDKAHLSVAVARYKQGKLAGHSKEEVAAHIRSRAKALGETVDLAAGSGLEEAADVLALAKATGDGGIIMNHAPWTGSHEHGHFQGNVHKHPHQHFGDNSHDGGPAHRPGSKPGGRPGW